ncbi:hypothetical protein ACQWU4_13940 [Chryseobacterium sp. MIQD13]|uniref:hypothetical protein n=1 Tax=Chryseobacterium sp. MIQD13 TaxID=3422310 RepID=UPI003D29CF71
MKNIFKLLLICFCTSKAFGQVGIGTTAPATSSALDITSSNKGVLIPKVELTAKNLKSPLAGNIPDGTMVFNTLRSGTGADVLIPGIYVWMNNKWNFPAELGTAESKAVKFASSPASTTNFNPATVASPVGIDIFNSAVFNDDAAMFEKIDDYQLKINQSGLYLVSLNLALKQAPAVDQSRLSDYIYFNLNGNLASAKVITLVPQYNPGDINIGGRFAFGLNSYIQVTAGSVLTLRSQRYKDGADYNGILNFDGVSTSSVTIVKIQ